MTAARRGLSFALLLALACTALASASSTRHWQDSKRGLRFDVARGHFQSVNWDCKGTRLVTAAWGSDTGPRVHHHGRFRFKTSARVFDNTMQTGTTKLRMRGRFVRRNGKRRAVGKVRSPACFDGWRKFRAKRVSGGY